MKRTFILFLVGFFAVATVAYLLYLFFDALHGMYKDWRLGREMDEIQTWTRNQKKAATNDQSSTSTPPDAS